MRLESLCDDVHRVGRDAGLDAIGICDAAPFEQAHASLVAGLERGWDAGMQFTYRNPARSTDPHRLMEGAAAMIVGARRYDRQLPTSPDRDRADGRPLGAVARYAWTDHYRELRSSLGQVADHLRSKGWRAAVVVDDNALVDRAAAVRAGIGWYGKNTNVLIPGVGSWFVLGSVVTDAPLAPNQRALANNSASGAPHMTGWSRSRSESPKGTPGVGSVTLTPGPVEDGCGSCRRCIDACPTGALSDDEPGHLDARRCLAWLVQAPGVFPREYRVALHGRIYGCDDCQEACPVNRLAERRSPPEKADRDATVAVDVIDMLEADDAELLDRFGRWYIPRRDPKYLRRNALIVLGNIADPKSASVRTAVAKATLDPDPIIRSHAVWAAARLGYTDLTPASDPDPIVHDEVAASPSVPSRAVAR